MAIWCILFLSSGYLRDEKREMSEIKESVYWMSYRNGLCVCVCVRVCVCVFEREIECMYVYERMYVLSSQVQGCEIWLHEQMKMSLLSYWPHKQL